MLLHSKTFSYTQKIPEDFGYRHLAFKYLNDPVNVVIISKTGEERVAKPLFLFCQGNLPQPVIKYDQKGLHPLLPFDENPFLEHYHIAIIAQPFIPLIANTNQLSDTFDYCKDLENGVLPKGFTERNYLDYYVFRNNAILRQLFKERWIRTSRLLVVGHAEGAAVGVKMAAINTKVTQLVCAGGNPYGKIINQLMQHRQEHSGTTNPVIAFWKQVVENASETNVSNGNSYKMTYSFSLPQKDQLLGLTIPVLMVYGTKDGSAIFNDLFQIEAIRERKQNIAFKSYVNFDTGMATYWIDWLKAQETS